MNENFDLNNGGLKCRDLSNNYSKTSDLPTFQQNESSNESFFGHTKADQVVVIMSGQSYVPISWKGFFTVFQVILTSIAEPQSFLFKRSPLLSFIQEDADKKEGLLSQISKIASHVRAMYTTLLDSQRFTKL